MTKGKFLTGLIGVAISLMIISCGKDNGNPTIKFIPGPGFTGKDTIIKVNDTLPVKLDLNWNGTDLLDKLDVRVLDVTIQTFEVEGETVTFLLNLVKGTDEVEEWSFVIIDVKGNQSSVDLTLTKDPNSIYGAFRFYATVQLGAQNNTLKSPFISFQDNKALTFNLDQAFTNPSKIDLLFYYDEVTKATLASPGSDLPDNLYRNINSWAIRPVSRFLKSAMTVPEFNNMTTDAPIIDGWNDTLSVSKATELKPNDIWLIKMSSGKKGVLLVKQAGTNENGEIDFAIKVQ